MENQPAFRKESESEDEDTTTKYLWMHPKEIHDGFYLYKITNTGEESFRISQVEIEISKDINDKIYFQVPQTPRIRPLEIVPASLDIQISCKHHFSPRFYDTHQEVACLEVENLLKPRDKRYLWLFRAYLETKNQYIVHAYTDETKHTPWVEEVSMRHHNSKVATRVIINLSEDQDPATDTKTRLAFKTHTIFAPIHGRELELLRRLHNS